MGEPLRTRDLLMGACIGALVAVAALEAHFTWRALVKKRSKAAVAKPWGVCEDCRMRYDGPIPLRCRNCRGWIRYHHANERPAMG